MGVEGALEFCASRPEVGYLAIVPGDRMGQVEVITSNLSDDVFVAL
jgi:hypothetical protein